MGYEGAPPSSGHTCGGIVCSWFETHNKTIRLRQVQQSGVEQYRIRSHHQQIICHTKQLKKHTFCNLSSTERLPYAAEKESIKCSSVEVAPSTSQLYLQNTVCEKELM
jgi:hypothetical protein